MLGALRSLVVGFFMGVMKTLTRVTSFFGKEITEVIRRPGALVSLILGPFLIMALFGFGYSGNRRPLDTVIVAEKGANLPQDAGYYQKIAGSTARIVDVTDDLKGAETRLQHGDVDLLVIAPADLEGRFKEGQQSIIRVEYNQLDPVRSGYIRFVADQQVNALNEAIIRQAATSGQQYAVQTLQDPSAAKIPPEVIAAPTRSEMANRAPIDPTMLQFFAPAVLALVLQHMGVTLTALSIVRERLSGVVDIFRVSPVRTLEILVGKYLAFGFLNLLVGAASLFLLVSYMGIPMLGSLYQLAGVIALLTFASLGLGLFISTVADSERQAVQLSMLLLLASVFLSGFVLPLDEFVTSVQWLAYALPVTHGIRLLQDTMLRGSTFATWQLWALGGFGGLLFLANELVLRRSLSRA